MTEEPEQPRRRVLIEGTGRRGEPRGGVARAADAPAVCVCPVLEASDWDGVESDWSDITFVRTSLAAVAGVPVGFDRARAELERHAEALGATIPPDAMLLIGEGRFRRTLLLEVDAAPATGDRIYRPGGFAYTRLVEAPWGELGRATKAFRAEATERYGRQPRGLYAWYLTCRVCSRDRNFETLLVAAYPDVGR